MLGWLDNLSRTGDSVESRKAHVCKSQRHEVVSRPSVDALEHRMHLRIGVVITGVVLEIL